MRRGTDRDRLLPNGTYRAGLLSVVLVGLLLTGSVAASLDGAHSTARSQETDADSAFEVALDSDGDATVIVHVTFDLSDEADRAAFESLEANETKRSQLETRTERRLQTVATSAANETGREMAIEDTRTSFETDEGTDRGIVSVSATWTEFAATDDDRLTVTEPFASGFTSERPVVMALPEGYSLSASTPEPSERTDGRIVWDANTSLEGYEAVVTPADESADEGTDEQPGFGLGAAVAAIAGSAWLYRRR
ncbi:hypothetical protein A6E15_12265 [Natrinema saccharevitans]|uniref:DUF4897 domain-containing protein n=1 Tax=Natrinema saccharevitans TaxID=301967 RepID=A0A1S8AYK7_9EURY|nr:PGF-CTERM sorting domain-containing protein [Natrinema saccharevitans]OLZ41712.1 hypothetical protein A6E15_12265 [Natrinema saccharevitans]